jgi:hypothetical protein
LSWTGVYLPAQLVLGPATKAQVRIGPRVMAVANGAHLGNVSELKGGDNDPGWFKNREAISKQVMTINGSNP